MWVWWGMGCILRSCWRQGRMAEGGGGDMRGVFVDPVVCMTVAEVSTEEVSEAFAVTLQHLAH